MSLLLNINLKASSLPILRQRTNDAQSCSVHPFRLADDLCERETTGPRNDSNRRRDVLRSAAHMSPRPEVWSIEVGIRGRFQIGSGPC